MPSGPIVLFDKSFLQSLSLDESLWFDTFFVSNVCPVFYAETLADLEKKDWPKDKQEYEVQTIAKKFPDLQGAPCVMHTDLSASELRGQFSVPKLGQIPLAGGVPLQVRNRRHVVYRDSPEVIAFNRWQKGQFADLEREQARQWREAMSKPRSSAARVLLDTCGLTKEPKTLEEARSIAAAAAQATSLSPRSFEVAVRVLAIKDRYRQAIKIRWVQAGRPPLPDYAPYSSHLLQVTVFTESAMRKGLISEERPSNRVDMAYLYYLPFCMIFVSSDNLHRRCAGLFCRDNQRFVWGPDLKTDLTKLDAYYAGLSTEERAKGVLSFARFPPRNGDFLVTELWDQYLPNWRDSEEKSKGPEMLALRNSPELKAMFDQIAAATREAKTSQLSRPPTSLERADSMSIERRIRRTRGKWKVVADDIPDSPQ